MTPRSAKPRPRPQSGPGRKALLAEDNDINALIAHKALRRLGFEVTRAADGQEAVRLASRKAPGAPRPFDLILMDLKMPELDGYEATRRLRRLEAADGWPPTPIVALTANALDEDPRSCASAGFDAFLRKPIELGELATAIDRVCAPRESMAEERSRAS